MTDVEALYCAILWHSKRPSSELYRICNILMANVEEMQNFYKGKSFTEAVDLLNGKVNEINMQAPIEAVSEPLAIAEINSENLRELPLELQ